MHQYSAGGGGLLLQALPHQAFAALRVQLQVMYQPGTAAGEPLPPFPTLVPGGVLGAGEAADRAEPPAGD